MTCTCRSTPMLYSRRSLLLLPELRLFVVVVVAVDSSDTVVVVVESGFDDVGEKTLSPPVTSSGP